MKYTNISRCVSFLILGLAAATLAGCNSKSDKEANSAVSVQVGNELKSLGMRSTGVLEFDLKCKSLGSKLYWVLEVRQTVLGKLGLGGYSGNEVAEMARRIQKEFQLTTAIESNGIYYSKPQNKIRIEFMDKNGFTVVESVTTEISSVDADGKDVDTLMDGWYYRGVIDLDPSEISRVSNYQLGGDFTQSMESLLQEAGGLVEKKKKERNSR